ncbi:MAG: trp operon repressor [Chlamydiia bacterium]|nr:trp operon repressor [Chlamydiia bacterium]
MDKDGWRKFIQVLTHVDDPKTLETLSKLFFTPEERESLAGRARIIQELIQGKRTQREIAKKYGISIAKITRGSNALKEISDEMKEYLIRVME